MKTFPSREKNNSKNNCKSRLETKDNKMKKFNANNSDKISHAASKHTILVNMIETMMQCLTPTFKLSVLFKKVSHVFMLVKSSQ